MVDWDHEQLRRGRGRHRRPGRGARADPSATRARRCWSWRRRTGSPRTRPGTTPAWCTPASTTTGQPQGRAVHPGKAVAAGVLRGEGACRTTSAASSSSRSRTASSRAWTRWSRARPATACPVSAGWSATGIREVEPHAAGVAALHSPAHGDHRLRRRRAGVRRGHRGGRRRGPPRDRGHLDRAAGLRRRGRHHAGLAPRRPPRHLCRPPGRPGLAAGRRRRRSADRAVPGRVHGGLGGQARPRARDGLPGPRPALPVPRGALHAASDRRSWRWVPTRCWPCAGRGTGVRRPARATSRASLGWPGFWRMSRRHWRTGLTEIRGSLSVAAYMRRASLYVPEIGRRRRRAGRGRGTRPGGRPGRLARRRLPDHPPRRGHQRAQRAVARGDLEPGHRRRTSSTRWREPGRWPDASTAEGLGAAVLPHHEAAASRPRAQPGRGRPALARRRRWRRCRPTVRSEATTVTDATSAGVCPVRASTMWAPRCASPDVATAPRADRHDGEDAGGVVRVLDADAPAAGARRTDVADHVAAGGEAVVGRCERSRGRARRAARPSP